MTQAPEDDEADASRRLTRGSVLVFIGVGVAAMGAFLLVQQVTGGPLVWDRSHDVYWTRMEAIELATGMMLSGGGAWWWGLRLTDPRKRKRLPPS